MNATEAPILRAEGITHAFTAMIMAEDTCWIAIPVQPTGSTSLN